MSGQKRNGLRSVGNSGNVSGNPPGVQTSNGDTGGSEPISSLTMGEEYQPKYRHEIRPIPPYALDKLAEVYHRDPVNKSAGAGVDGEQDGDPFIRAMDNNWNNFLKTVEANPLYPVGVTALQNTHSKESDGSSSWDAMQLDLEGKWGGDDRLRLTFNRDTPDISPYDDYGKEKLEGWSAFWKQGVNSKNSSKENGILQRSNARYWMSTEKRDDLKSTLKRILLNNPYVPLFFRILELVFSVVALGLAVRIFVLSNRTYNDYTVGQQPSTIMAICLQSIAIVYLLFIARDEFGGRPLGLRDPLQKMRLILLDLLFIIFSSANLSLAFNTLYDDQWVCVNLVQGTQHIIVLPICHQQRGLAAFLFVMLCTWVVTFTISIVRVVEKVASPTLSVYR